MICRYCGKVFDTTDENRLACDSCEQDFKQLKEELSLQGKPITECKLCGKPFIHPLKRYCDGINGDGKHYRGCNICGKPILYDRLSDSPKQCSAKCRSERMRRIGSRPPHKTRICPKCGKEFQPESSNQMYCKDQHYNTCVICGKQFPVNFNMFNSRTCSDKCKWKLVENTSLERYGATNYLGSEEGKANKDRIMLEKYGVKHYIHHPDYAEKTKKTCQERYGTDYPTQSKEFIEARNKTNQRKYGGNSPMCSKDVQDKMSANYRAKYGVDWYNQTEEGKKKIIMGEAKRFAKTISDPKKREAYLKFKENPREFLESLSEKPTPRELMDLIGHTDPTTVYSTIHTEDLGDLIDYRASIMESEIIDFIYSLDPEVKIFKHDRKQIAPYELDVYLPEYRLGIECNPTVTHNSTVTLDGLIEGKNSCLPRRYHAEKSAKCSEVGIFLFHIFGYEWTYNSDVIKSMICNLIGLNSQKFYARKLQVVDVNASEARDCLAENHRQGYASSKVRLGLKTPEGELVSLMTFGKIRSTIGESKSNSDNTWELVRFCNLRNTSVVGGASKLFKYFIRNYDFDTVISFSDVAHTKGNLYSTLGFEEASRSDCGYTWVSLFDDFYLNRVSTQKRNLPKLFGNPELDIKNQTEDQIMVSYGFVKVYDCGTIRWEYSKSFK